jgi:signal transduction histidine kinase
VKIIPDFVQGFRMLATGALDAVVADRWVGSYVLAENNIRGVKLIEELIGRSHSAIAVKKGNANLLGDINSALADIRRDGTYDRIIKSWRSKEVVFKTREQLCQQAWLIAAISVALIVALFSIAALVMEIRRRKRGEEALRHAKANLEQRVQERTADLEKANGLLKKSEEALRHLASKILTAQEQERNRLAGELHDGLGQSLSALKMYLRAIQRHLPKEAEVVREDFEDAQKLLRETIEETRKISRGLSPTLLENLGLTAGVKYLLDEFGNQHKTKITFDADDIQSFLSHPTEINLFRVCQEAINNIAKHSLATQVSVAIKRQDGSVNFCIKDNGVGFDLDQFSQADLSEKGMGVASMGERLRMIGAHLTILSQIGIGTEISFSIPLDAN